jgi:hypothetical protein
MILLVCHVNKRVLEGQNGTLLRMCHAVMTFIILTYIVLCPHTEPPFACSVGCSLSQQFLPSALMSIAAGSLFQEVKTMMMQKPLFRIADGIRNKETEAVDECVRNTSITRNKVKKQIKFTSQDTIRCSQCVHVL